MKQPPTGEAKMTYHCIGDKVAFTQKGIQKSGYITRIRAGVNWGEYAYQVQMDDQKFANVMHEEITRVIISHKFKKGQMVNSFHYNENMRSATFETGHFVRYVSEKIAIVRINRKLREVVVAGLRAYSETDEVYYIGTTTTRKPLSEIFGKGLLGRKSGSPLMCILEIFVDDNGVLRFDDFSGDLNQTATGIYMTKFLYDNHKEIYGWG